MIELIPAILVKTKKKLLSELKAVSKDVKTVQIDIMDNKFVPNKTIQPKDVMQIKGLRYEYQLMVEDPWKYIPIKNAYMVIFHLESCLDDLEAFNLIKHIKKFAKVGIGLNPKTDVKRIKPFLKEIDLVLVMTVKPGFGGQRFKPSMLKKVKQIRKWDKKIRIEVDGGVNEKNVCDCIKAGVNNLVVGSAIFKEKNIHKEILDFKKLIK